jgi:hypothetical protein
MKGRDEVIEKHYCAAQCLFVGSFASYMAVLIVLCDLYLVIHAVMPCMHVHS